MNVLLLTDGMMPGGVERHVVHLANGLYDQGINVSLAATGGPFMSQLHHSISFLELPILYPDSSSKRPLGVPQSVLLLRKYIHAKDIQILHSHKRYTDFIARITLLYSKKYIHVSTCHNVFSDMTWFPSFGAFTITCSRMVADMVHTTYKKPLGSVKTIYNGVPALSPYSDEQKRDIKKQLGLSDKTTIISCVGSLSKRKNPKLLLETFSRLAQKDNIPSLDLILVGDGSQKNILKEQIQNYGLQEHIHILPADSSIEDILNISEFCVLPSLREGLPLVILEAASIKKPYIATNVGGISEFIENNVNGILVPPNSASALEEAISYLLLNPEKVHVFGEHAQAKYQQQFTAERMVQETIALYEKLLVRTGTMK